MARVRREALKGVGGTETFAYQTAASRPIFSKHGVAL